MRDVDFPVALARCFVLKCFPADGNKICGARHRFIDD